MKRFFEFLKQAFLGDSKGLGSKTANMTVDQLVKVGTDMNVDKATAEKMVTAFLTTVSYTHLTLPTKRIV